MAILGYGPTHDFAFHVGNWMEVAQQWRSGILMPQWAAQANYGYGDPRFIFYPPLSWITGAILGLLFPWKVVPALFVMLALTTAGASMFLLAREWLPQRYAVLAAVIYVANPYEVMLVYKRMAAAEMLASAIFPLLLLLTLRVCFRRNAIVPLAAIYAAIWLTNAPSAVIASYSVAFVLITAAAYYRNLRPLLQGGISLLLGFGLAAVYMVPAAWEQRWVDISFALTLPHNRPENNFIRLFPPRMPGGIASIVTVGVVNLVLAAVVCGVAFRKRNSLPRQWWMLAALVLFAAAFTLPPSLPIWKLLPKLLFVQLPWRWLFVVNAACALLLAITLPTLGRRARWTAMAVPVLVFLVLLGSYATKGKPGAVADLQQTIIREGGYRGEAAYLPRGEYHATAGFDVGVRRDESSSVLRLVRRDARSLIFQTSAPQPTTVQLDIAWYPAWRASIDGTSATLINSAGLIAVEVPAGPTVVEVYFARTPDRLIGSVISLLAVFAAAILALINRRKKASQTQFMLSDVTRQSQPV